MRLRAPVRLRVLTALRYFLYICLQISTFYNDLQWFTDVIVSFRGSFFSASPGTGGLGEQPKSLDRELYTFARKKKYWKSPPDD